MSDADFKLLREMLHAAYLDVNPEISDRGSHLVRKLAEGLYARGGRVSIGTTQPELHVFVHQSVDPLGHMVWTCKKWNEIMGYHSGAPVGRHLSDFLTPDSFHMFSDFVWPELIREGKVEQVPVTYIRSTGELLQGLYRGEIMRDSKGGFARTFAKIRITINGITHRLVSAASLVLLSVA